jgi:hypothetical protein
MPVFHRSQRLKIYGSRVEVTQLHNSRYELVVRCTANNDTEAWYNSNKAQIFADFGTLYDAQMSIEGIDPRTGEAYPNMVLVQNEAGFTRTGDYVITFIYETLTDSFVQESEEKVDHELNGLRRVTRTIIAKSGTSYGKLIGSATITHSALGYGSKTLTLASVQEDVLDSNEGGFVRLQETWLEAGELSQVKNNLKDGIIQVTTEFLVTEGATVGPIIRRSEDNTNGLKTISVTTLQKKDGTSVLAGLDGDGVATSPVSTHSSLNAFTYPGVVNLVKRTIDARSYSDRDDITSFEYYLTPPAESLITTTTFVLVQTKDTLVEADKTFNSSNDGLWNPESWASTYTSGVDINKNPFSKTDALRGYRALSDLDVIVTEPANDFSGNFLVNGRPILNGNAANIGMKGGPSDPEGGTFVLDITIVPAFETVDGTVAFKKRITTATIPARTVSYLPEGGTQVGTDFSSSSGRFSSSQGVGSVLQADGNILADANAIPVLQLDFNKSPTNASDLEHSCIAIVKGSTSGTEEARVITDYNTTTKKVTLSSGLANHANYTLTSTNFYSLYGFTRVGFISQNIGNGTTKFLLDHTKTKIPRSTTYNDVFNGVTLFITEGTGAGEGKEITDYDAISGQVTTVAFTATLDATSKYRIGPA